LAKKMGSAIQTWGVALGWPIWPLSDKEKPPLPRQAALSN
jgi:hypothetical protein